MNDLIEQLSEKAKNSIPEGLVVDEWIKKYNKAFAELIIQDCAQFCYDNNELRVEQAYNLRKQIYQHYGIEK